MQYLLFGHREDSTCRKVSKNCECQRQTRNNNNRQKTVAFLGCLYFPFVRRQRPALGECLAHLAAAMPVAFLEPELNEFNMFSVYTTKTPRERSSEFPQIAVIFSSFSSPLISSIISLLAQFWVFPTKWRSYALTSQSWRF